MTRPGISGRLVAFSVALALLAGCSAAGTPQPLTEDQAERLAVLRFSNYQDRLVTVRGTVPSGAGELRLAGRLDFVDHVGYVRLDTPGAGGQQAEHGVLQWSQTVVAYFAGATQDTDPPPAGRWQLRPLSRAGGELDTALSLLLGLGNDRPDNPQLLRQSSARWLRSDTVNGTAVDVFEGPRSDGGSTGSDAARLRYWLDASAHLRRIEARLGNADQYAVFDFASGAGAFTVLPQLVTPA